MASRGEVWAGRAEVVARFGESGLSMAEFCRREGIGYAQFQAWRRRLSPPRAAEAAGGFAELVVESQAPEPASGDRAAAAPVEVLLPGGATIRVYTGADAALLRAVAEAFSRC